MTRITMLLLTLLASMAFGQTYVRPSKGTSFAPIPSADPAAGAGWSVAPGNAYNFTSTLYDWTAFETVRIRVWSTSNAASDQGNFCNGISLQYNVSDLGNVVKFLVVSNGSTGWFLYVQDAPSPTGRFNFASGPNAKKSLSVLNGCSHVFMQVTPVPFSVPPTNATSTASLVPAQNAIYTTSLPFVCGANSLHTALVMDGGALLVGSLYGQTTDGGFRPTSAYVTICNARDNTATGYVRCRDDGVAPVITAGTAGTVLGVGDCVLFSSNQDVTNPLKCIGTNNWISVYECAP